MKVSEKKNDVDITINQRVNNEEKKLLYKLKRDYSCGICLSVINNAITTPCGHLYCQICIKAWEQSVFPYLSCPKCRKPFNMDKVIRVYNNSSNCDIERIKSPSNYKDKVNVETHLQCQQLGNIILYETDFSDAVSLKSIIYLILAFGLTIFLLFYIV